MSLTALEKCDIRKSNAERIRTLWRAMTPVQGEQRVIYQCGDCKKLFGRRFVPYGLGYGLTVGSCVCQLTGHRPMHEVASKNP